MKQMSEIHLWIGKTKKEEEEYLKYFELDYSTEGDFNDPNYIVCQFCKDIGEKWYDEDFMGIIPIFDEELVIKDILKQVPISNDEIDNVVSKAESLGVFLGNAVFYLTDADIDLPEPYKNNYNDLKYIGKFASSMK
jgi:Immunity protein 22